MLALMPDVILNYQIEQERIRFSEKYKAYESLRRWIHITLEPPFATTDRVALLVVEKMKTVSTEIRSFLLDIQDYKFFGDHTVFLNLKPNQTLAILQERIHHALSVGFPVPLPLHQRKSFRPHITIAYRDIPKTSFPAIKSEYKQKAFRAEFPVTHFYLWRHTGVYWDVIESFPLQPMPSSEQVKQLTLL